MRKLNKGIGEKLYEIHNQMRVPIINEGSSSDIIDLRRWAWQEIDAIYIPIMTELQKSDTYQPNIFTLYTSSFRLDAHHVVW